MGVWVTTLAYTYRLHLNVLVDPRAITTVKHLELKRLCWSTDFQTIKQTHRPVGRKCIIWEINEESVNIQSSHKQNTLFTWTNDGSAYSKRWGDQEARAYKQIVSRQVTFRVANAWWHIVYCSNKPTNQSAVDSLLSYASNYILPLCWTNKTRIYGSMLCLCMIYKVSSSRLDWRRFPRLFLVIFL